MTMTCPAIIRFTVAVPLALAVLFSVPAQRSAAGKTIARAGSIRSLGAAAFLHRMSNGKFAFIGFAGGSLDVINPDGSGLRILARCKTHSCVISDAVWSPDGRRIAFLRGRPPRREVPTGREVPHTSDISLFVKNADGSGEKRLAGCGRPVGCDDHSRLAWSPDGSMIAFTRQRSLYTVHVETHALRRITNCSPWFSLPDRKQSCVDLNPTWSPDGRRITFARAFGCGGGGCPSQPFIVNADGSGLRRLTLLYCGRGPLWSPNGREIVFDTSRGIYAVDPDGSHLKLLAAGPDVNQWQIVSSWSPDGQRILYFRSQVVYPTPHANGEVWVMNANGSGRRRLFVRCCGTGVLPIWSPDGKHIAFSVASAKPQDSGIYLMDTNGSHLHRVRAGNWAELAWQPIP